MPSLFITIGLVPSIFIDFIRFIGIVPFFILKSKTLPDPDYKRYPLALATGCRDFTLD